MLIKTNEALKMKIRLVEKELLWRHPHHYLCVQTVDKNAIFRIFTSNLLAGFFRGNIDDMLPISHSIFFKQTYLVMNERFVFKDIKFPEKRIKEFFPVDKFASLDKTKGKNFVIDNPKNIIFV